jgi:hypothetical protein
VTGDVRLMLADVVAELVSMAAAAKEEAAAMTGDDFAKGRLFALYEAISLIAQQADAFGIDRADVGLGGVDPERDLLGS